MTLSLLGGEGINLILELATFRACYKVQVAAAVVSHIKRNSSVTYWHCKNLYQKTNIDSIIFQEKEL